MAIIRSYKAGRTVTQLAADWGVSHGTVRKDIDYAFTLLKQSVMQDATDLRALQLERLQQMFGAIYPAMLAGDTAAANTVLGILKREADLLGLDAPKKIDIEGRLRAMAEAEGFDPDQAIEVARTEILAS